MGLLRRGIGLRNSAKRLLLHCPAPFCRDLPQGGGRTWPRRRLPLLRTCDKCPRHCLDSKDFGLRHRRCQSYRRCPLCPGHRLPHGKDLLRGGKGPGKEGLHSCPLFWLPQRVAGSSLPLYPGGNSYLLSLGG